MLLAAAVYVRHQPRGRGAESAGRWRRAAGAARGRRGRAEAVRRARRDARRDPPALTGDLHHPPQPVRKKSVGPSQLQHPGRNQNKSCWTLKVRSDLVFLGLLMKRKTGRYLRKRTRIQLGMECVRGPLKFQLMMTTVTRMETVFMMKVKSKYLAMRGSTRDVGGRILETSSRKTTSESKMLMPKVTFVSRRKERFFLHSLCFLMGNRVSTIFFLTFSPASAGR